MNKHNEPEKKETNRISEQSREAWEKYGDNAVEKGFAFEREGEGLPGEDKKLEANPAKNLSGSDTQAKPEPRHSNRQENQRSNEKQNAGKKENALPETVSLNNEPYEGPSKLDRRSQDQQFATSGEEGKPGKPMIRPGDRLVKVPGSSHEDKTLTQNRTYTADSDHHQPPLNNPAVDYSSTPADEDVSGTRSDAQD